MLLNNIVCLDFRLFQFQVIVMEGLWLKTWELILLKFWHQ
jgi:hypothetical protein